MSDTNDPCKVCGSTVRLKRERLETLAGTELIEERVCTNRRCETNDPEPSLGTPAP